LPRFAEIQTPPQEAPKATAGESSGFPKVMIRLDRSNVPYGQIRKPFLNSPER
jgi:hypothetical protein